MATDHAGTSSKNDTLPLSNHAQLVSDVLFFSIGEGVIVTDERGTVARANKIALDILGCTSEELLGKWYPGTVIAEYDDGRAMNNLERPITEVFLTGKPVFKKLFYRRKDGSRVPVALTISPVIVDDRPIGAIEIFRDITDELQLEHAKDEFISIASHQLRTPATVVKQYLGMILDGYVESPQMQLDMIGIAYTHNDNQLNIINDLLKVAQIEANKLEASYTPTDIIALLEGIAASQQPEFKKRDIIFNLSHQASPINVSMDQLHLQMIMENLISNAIKYSHPGGKVTVEVSKMSTEVIVHVIDEGIGIAPADKPKLFNKFSRFENAKNTASGTGIGLYWAKKLVELYNGTITVISGLNKGSKFTITLPGESSL